MRKYHRSSNKQQLASWQLEFLRVKVAVGLVSGSCRCLPNHIMTILALCVSGGEWEENSVWLGRLCGWELQNGPVLLQLKWAKSASPEGTNIFSGNRT